MEFTVAYLPLIGVPLVGLARCEGNRCYALCDAVFELTLVAPYVRDVKRLLEKNEGLLVRGAELFRL